ncbi:MAG: AlpA family transcriptional regulator [Methylococcales bacterium]
MGASILRLPDVIKITALSRSAIYDLIAKGNFPKQIKLTSRSSGWIESEVLAWLDDRIAERDAKVA